MIRLILGLAIGVFLGYTYHGTIASFFEEGRCEDRGGVWNEETDSCELVEANGEEEVATNELETNNEEHISRVGGAITEQVQVLSPRPGDEVSSPITISGRAPGHWFFEASAPVALTNGNGLIIAEGYVTAEGEWMTTDLVDFSGTLTYQFETQPASPRMNLILKRANPSGLSENDAAVEFVVYHK